MKYCFKTAAVMPVVVCFIVMGAARHSLAGEKSDSVQTVKLKESPGLNPRLHLKAIRANSGIRLDGILDEHEWKTAPIGAGFTQLEPDDGQPSTERTTVQVAYDDEAIYVAVRAYDSQPHTIEKRLCRRDEHLPSDWIVVGIGSYNDKRTAFGFSVNPAGVKQDRLWYNDTEEDMNWDAVWDVKTCVNDEGWVAEFRIPFSQLRYSENGDSMCWGFQVAREMIRNNETSLWAPMARDENQLVSVFGTLEGLNNLPRSRRLEMLPYFMVTLDNYGDADDDPFRDKPVFDQRPGVDIKYGLTSNMTLDITANPDFGQIEQDPSEFNTTAYESYFEDKRPFFIEGANLFEYRLMFGDGDDERLYYSRRIGREPRFYPLDSRRWMNTDDFYEETPVFTKILGAAKVTGRTSNGWSIGVIEALTDKEQAQVELPGGERFGVAVEPMTNYFVTRAQKDYNNGRSTVGGIVTSVVRKIPNEDFNFLNRSAFTGGLDMSHRWNDDRYQITASIMGSHLRGSEEAMLELQTSPARYYQRPDATHLGVDSSLTHMNGFAANLWVGKFAGGHWRYGLGYITRTPGFEANDIGYMQDADLNLVAFWAGYREFEPGRILRQYSINCNVWDVWNYGGDMFGIGGNVNFWAQFLNYWSCYGGINRNQPSQSNALLRGGPSVLRPGNISSWHGFNTDNRKSVTFGYDGNYSRNDEGFYSFRMSPRLTIRPSGRFDMTIRPSYLIDRKDMQYVDEIGGSYILGHLDTRVLSITTRLNYTITPEMSLQFYGMPFIAAGDYSNLREVVSPHAAEYEDRFAPYDYADNPDFNFKQFRTNLVFRWEYSPGSTIFLVWSRGATDFEEEYGQFKPDRDLKRLFTMAGDNTFAIKINKWFNF